MGHPQPALVSSDFYSIAMSACGIKKKQREKSSLVVARVPLTCGSMSSEPHTHSCGFPQRPRETNMKQGGATVRWPAHNGATRAWSIAGGLHRRVHSCPLKFSAGSSMTMCCTRLSTMHSVELRIHSSTHGAVPLMACVEA